MSSNDKLADELEIELSQAQPIRQRKRHKERGHRKKSKKKHRHRSADNERSRSLDLQQHQPIMRRQREDEVLPLEDRNQPHHSGMSTSFNGKSSKHTCGHSGLSSHNQGIGQRQPDRFENKLDDSMKDNEEAPHFWESSVSPESETTKGNSESAEVECANDELDKLPVYYPALQGCRDADEFEPLNRIQEGTYGIVYRAKDKRTNEIVALKRLKREKEMDDFPITSLREINTLLKAQHENIVMVREIVVSTGNNFFIVMDYVEHDLKTLMETLKQKEQAFLIGEVKCLMIQLLRAVAHLHDNWILHRDLKTSNLLLSHKGILKVADFGLAREYGSPLQQYTPIVVTLWYRAPELLLGVKEYSTPIDVWSVGCIFGELLKMTAMFPGKSEANQLNLIFQTLGTPNDRIWPGYTEMPLLQKMTFTNYPVNKLRSNFSLLTGLGIDMLNRFLTFNPQKRITAEEALKHSYFTEAPLAIDPSVFPTWPAKSEMGHRKAAASPKPPSGGRKFKDLHDDDDDPTGVILGEADRRPPIGAGFSLKF